MALILVLILVAIVLGLVGVAAHGLLYLLFIGIVVLLIALALGGTRLRRGQRPAHPLTCPDSVAHAASRAWPPGVVRAPGHGPRSWAGAGNPTRLGPGERPPGHPAARRHRGVDLRDRRPPRTGCAQVSGPTVRADVAARNTGRGTGAPA